MAWYVVHVGCQTGVFSSWGDCHAQVDGFSGACYKKYRTKEEVFSAFYGQPGTNVASAAKNLNLMPLSRRDVVLVVLCAMLVVQALAIVYLIKKLM